MKMTEDRLIDQLKRHEGFSGKPYRDTVGKSTIGYGRNLDANPLSRSEGAYLLINDVRIHQSELEASHPIVNTIGEIRKAALVNMAYNLGVPSLNTFVKMWKAIDIGDWDWAAEEALDSKWARQVGHKRSSEIAFMIRNEDWLYA